MVKKILFVSHDASRTGAPIVLLHFLEWLKKQGQYQISVFLMQGGEMEDRFRSVASVYIPVPRTISKRIVNRLNNKAQFDPYEMPRALSEQVFDVVYLNTVVALRMAPVIKATFRCPVLCHVHENDYTIKNYYPDVVTDGNLQSVDHFIAVSESTRSNLIDNYTVPAKKVTLIYEFINLDQIRKPTEIAAHIKQELSLSGEFIVGGSGLTIWRKGPDLFMQLAAELNRMRTGNNIKLLWIGAVTNEFRRQYDYEATRLGIKGQVIFAGSKEAPQNYFQIFDVFALTSREDPFPLVVIEAASLAKPIVCFEAAGGMSEFVKDNVNGAVVPYGNVAAMAAAILQLADDKQSRLTFGEQAANLIGRFDISNAAPQIRAVIETQITTYA